MVKAGQIWENGVSAVKVQEDSEKKLLAVTFRKNEDQSLEFDHLECLEEPKLEAYLKDLNCTITNKELTVGQLPQ